jgi:hypothetical protein
MITLKIDLHLNDHSFFLKQKGTKKRPFCRNKKLVQKKNLDVMKYHKKKLLIWDGHNSSSIPERIYN